MDTRSDKRNEGIALLVATIFVAIGALLLTALSLRVINQSHQTDEYKAFNEFLADTGYTAEYIAFGLTYTIARLS